MPDWGELFSLSVPPLELVVRGTCIYWLLVIIFRFILRPTGAVGIADVLLLVIIADAAQNAMAGGYDTVSEGAILVGTIVGWNWLLDFLSFHFAPIRRFASPSRLTLVSRGVPQLRNMRRDYITMSELNEKLREQGIDDISLVKVAYLEGDGQISVIRNSGESRRKPESRRQGH